MAEDDEKIPKGTMGWVKSRNCYLVVCKADACDAEAPYEDGNWKKAYHGLREIG